MRTQAPEDTGADGRILTAESIPQPIPGCDGAAGDGDDADGCGGELHAAVDAGGAEHAVLGHRGRPEEALELLCREIATIERQRTKLWLSRLATWRAELEMECGNVAQALPLAEAALEACRSHDERGTEAWTLHLLGELASRRGSTPDVSEEYCRGSLALAEPRGMRPLIAHCHAGLGKLYQRAGKVQQAQEHVTTATTMYREMGMTYWLEKAEREARE